VVRRSDFSESRCRTLHMREQLIRANLVAVVSAEVMEVGRAGVLVCESRYGQLLCVGVGPVMCDFGCILLWALGRGTGGHPAGARGREERVACGRFGGWTRLTNRGSGRGSSTGVVVTGTVCKGSAASVALFGRNRIVSSAKVTDFCELNVKAWRGHEVASATAGTQGGDTVGGQKSLDCCGRAQ
jgi:hypothetical protein